MGFREGARDERLHVYFAGVSVEDDREAERVEDSTARLRIGGGEGASEIGQSFEDLACVVEVDRAVLMILRREGSEFGFDFAALGFQTADPFANEAWVDPCFDRSELQADPLVDVVESASQPFVER